MRLLCCLGNWLDGKIQQFNNKLFMMDKMEDVDQNYKKEKYDNFNL